MLNHFNASKFKLTLLVLDTSDSVFIDDIPAHVEIIDLGIRRVRYAIPKISWVLWKRRPDIVFSTLGHLNLAIGILRPFLPREVKFIARESNTVSEVVKDIPGGRFRKMAYKLFYNNFDKIVCQSKDMYDDLISNFNTQKEKAVIINNPVDINKIKSLAEGNDQSLLNEKNTNLVAAGRLVYQKGFDILLKALALTGNAQLHLTILGHGNERKNLGLIVNKLGITSQVTFAGFKDNPYPYFSAADFFVLSSRYEGFPNVVLEALACSTPVIATPCPGGIHEILSDINGCRIANAISPEALAIELNNLDKSRYFDCKVIQQWSAEKITEKYQRLFEALSN